MESFTAVVLVLISSARLPAIETPGTLNPIVPDSDPASPPGSRNSAPVICVIDSSGLAPPSDSAPFEMPTWSLVPDASWTIARFPVSVWPRTVTVAPVACTSRYGPPGTLSATVLEPSVKVWLTALVPVLIATLNAPLTATLEPSETATAPLSWPAIPVEVTSSAP